MITESRNPRTTDIDRADTLGVLRLINAEDALVAGAVAAALPALARAVDLAVDRLRRSGRVHYAGAGTSGRVAALDAAEIPPTFGVPDAFIAHLAGGPAALTAAVENAEDDAAAARRDLKDLSVVDLVVGLAASGRTPYVAGAFAAARAVGAATVLVTANPSAPLAPGCDVVVCVDTGAEALAGSTRMKAGTAQKMVLHSFSTAVMVRLGHTYSNLMVDVRATNAKLRARTLDILEEATGATPDQCRHALSESAGELKVALTALLATTDAATAKSALTAESGVVRAAVTRLNT